MPDEQGFLAAIREAPDDDTPRLIYADWLDDHGDADRAEFIRVQCEAERLGEFDPRRPELEERANELLAAHEKNWLGPLPEGALRSAAVPTRDAGRGGYPRRYLLRAW